jgi:phosphoribosylformimino-5-aminoimidazole carboxamide ribotide isomerase
MLIPSIDLKNNRVVQLVQGERLALEDHDLDKWIDTFARFRKLQLIDLDAAIGSGTNDALVRHACARRPCRVGGGIRTVERARAVLDAGATHVIVGSALFANDTVDETFAQRLAEAIGPDRIIAAVDTRGGEVTIHGWRTTLPLTAVEAARILEPYCSEFLFTIVDGEGMMQGIDMDAVRRLRGATTRDLVAAGGITTKAEVDALDAMGVDAVVGMAIYTGALSLDEFTSS